MQKPKAFWTVHMKMEEEYGKTFSKEKQVKAIYLNSSTYY